MNKEESICRDFDRVLVKAMAVRIRAFCACAWWAGLASPAWSSLAGVVYRGGVGWVHGSRAGIGSAGAARRAGAWKGPANYCVSCVTRSAVTSMTLTAEVGALS